MEVSTEKIWEFLKEVKDPEIPAIDVVEMGVVRDIKWKNNKLCIVITPTYSSCPAMKMIETSIVQTLHSKGILDVSIQTQLFPVWTTDWLNDSTRQKLKEYGIAPPGKEHSTDFLPFSQKLKPISCPFCNSTNTQLKSEFGSTLCKSLYYCKNCQQPFEYFKCI